MNHDFSVQAPGKRLDRIYVDVQRRDASFRVPSDHLHPYFEIYYLASGSCRFFLESRMLDVHEGDLMLIPPRSLHYSRYLYGPCERYALFFRASHVEPEVRDSLSREGTRTEQSHLFRIPDFSRQALISSLDWMIREASVNDEQTPLLMRYRLQELLLQLGRIGAAEDEVPALIHTTEKAVVQAAEYMRDHLQAPLRSEEIARAAGFSPDYLSRKFRQATGMSVHAYLTFLRLRKASVELRETDRSITEIALSCGFSDSNYFKDCFRQHYGCSPRAWRTLSEQL